MNISSAIQPEFSDNALRVLERRYLIKDDEGKPIETPKDMLCRVARVVASVEVGDEGAKEKWANTFYEMMARLEFLPNSPTLMNAGTPMGQLAACFVLPVGDSMEDIFDSLSATAMVHKSGGGTGFNFSNLRPTGDRVRSTSGVASGPVSFMELFDHTTEVVKQGGIRRGANMGILEASHPDIEEFVKAKTEKGKLTNFNISVGITADFIEALEQGKEWPLRNPRTKEVVRSVAAKDLWKLLVESAWKTGDPGIVFLDRIEEGNTVPLCGVMNTTNPCGEQPLLPYESCNLGSINLARMSDNAGKIDWDKLEQTVRNGVRFLDNVIDANTYPLPAISEMTRKNRKIGLGIMGWAELLFKRRVRYGSSESIQLAEKIMGFIQRVGHDESEKLSQERGCFPNWEGSVWQKQDRPMRNATVTTIAPTGTISLIAECSSGIEPVFALAFRRKAFDSDTLVYVNPYFEEALARLGEEGSSILEGVLETGGFEGVDAPKIIRELFVTAHDIPYIEHIQMQAAFQKYTDNAVSKTINLPNSASIEDVDAAYRYSYQAGCKGITVYRDRCKETQVLYHGATDRDDVKIAPISQEGFAKPRNRPSSLMGTTVKVRTGFGKLYLTLNQFDGKPFELFATLGKSGKDTQAHTEALGRLISLSLRSGIDVHDVIAQLKGIGGSQPIFERDGIILSLPDAIAQGLERALGETVTLTESEMCPSCGAPTIHSEGGLRCVSCDYSRCL